MSTMRTQEDVARTFGDAGARRTLSIAARSPLIAVAAVWVSSALLAIFAPDLVTGSDHEHLPIAAMTVWPWTFAATAYVLMAARRSTSTMLVWGTMAIWVSIFVAGIAAPVMETGTDPTQIPIAALITPPLGALATALVALHAATHPGSPAQGGVHDDPGEPWAAR
ncbi:hypothetical protein ACWEOW_14200 [Monashia sp. NPDC004114]